MGAEGPSGRWAAVIVLLALVERFLAPAVVVAATASGALSAFAVGAALTGVAALRGVVQGAQVARAEARLYVRVIGSVLKQDVLQPSVLPDEEARAALFDAAKDVAAALGAGLPNLGANTAAAALFGVLLAFFEPARIVVLVVVCGAAAVVLLLASRRAIQAAQDREGSAWARLADGVNDAIDGRLEIVAGGRADDYVASFGQTVSLWQSASMQTTRVARLAGRLPMLALAATVGGVVLVDSMRRGETASQTLGRAALLASLSPPFAGITQGLLHLVRTNRRLQNVLALSALPPTMARLGTHEVLAEVRALDVKDLRFAYGKRGAREDVLRGVSFSWRAGEVLALAGANGSGKSTCLRVLLGLGQKSSGEVLVNHVPLERLDVDDWRRAIAFLPQRPFLPPRSTVRQCLRFVDATITEEAMIEALEQVGLNVGVGSGRLALDVRVDDLSVGQRQRIGLARALSRRAPLVVLDEPDANLDSAGVRLVARIVRDLARERMVLVAAHSPELLSAADRVITLDAGHVQSDVARTSGSA